jgi:hypothetical protein
MKKFLGVSSLLILLGILVIASLVSVFARIKVEQANKTVWLAAESDMIESLAAAQGISLDEALSKLKAAGMGAVVFQEQTVAEIISEGRAELNGITVGNLATPIKSLTLVDQSTTERVVHGFGIRFGNLMRNNKPRGNVLALPDADTASIRTCPIGIDPVLAQKAKSKKLGIIARCINPTGIRSGAVRQTLDWAHSHGADAFLALGEQVLGRRDALGVMQDVLKQHNMLYLSPEFTKLGGDAETIAKIPELTVRLHSAQSAELDKLSIEAAVERYAKAAKERNMRVLLLRSISGASDAPVDSFGEFMGKLKSELEQSGYSLGKPEPFKSPVYPAFLRWIISLAGAGLIFWVSCHVLPARFSVVAGGFLAAICALGGFTNGTGLQLAAMLIANATPVAAVVWVFASKPNPWVGFFGMAAISMVGGLAVAGLLNGVLYYIRSETFVGVKLTIFAPIFVGAVLAFREFANVSESLKTAITWGAAITGMLVVGVLLVLAVRSGNDNPAAVSGGELAFRGWLENLFPVRPRTKSFMIGFPALAVALAMCARYKWSAETMGRKAGWVTLAFCVGLVGLTDVVNTLTHLHTPVIVSLWRNLFGILLGGLFGLVAWFIATETASRARKIERG